MPPSAVQIAAASDEANEPATIPADARWKQVQMLSCRLSVETRVPGFTLRDLLNLRAQSIVRSHLASRTNPPLRVNGEVVAWCEFEVLGSRLAVRLTELA
jgi:flagellar motor switch/type III secretory pathway protein FliN